MQAGRPGGQPLYEIRTRARIAASDVQVESDADGGNGEYGAVNAYGQVSYTHAGGIDRPIGVMRTGSNSLLAAFYPQTNWRGQYELATIDNGTQLTPLRAVRCRTPEIGVGLWTLRCVHSISSRGSCQ